MRSILSVAILALSATTASGPGLAQYGPPPAPAERSVPDRTVATPVVAAAPVCQAKISKDARKPLVALQAAAGAGNAAAFPALLAAAQAVAKTGDDKCMIALLQLKVAADAKDLRGMAAAVAALRASNSYPAGELATKYEALGQLQSEAKSYPEAATSFEQAVQIAPGRGSAVVMLAETRAKQDRVAEAIPLYRKAIALETGAGRKPPETWYKRMVAVAFNAKSPLSTSLARDWVAAYPSATNWRDAIKVHEALSGLEDSALLDMFRLARLNRALVGDSDYHRFAQVVLSRGYAGEAKALLDEGFAAKAIDRTKPVFKTAYATASAKAAGDRAALDGQVSAAEAGAAAKPLMALGEAYYGYGDFARSAAMFRKALTKSGVDSELANLRLGMALGASGDKAGAKTALDRVTGPRAEIARYWLTWLASRP